MGAPPLRRGVDQGRGDPGVAAMVDPTPRWAGVVCGCCRKRASRPILACCRAKPRRSIRASSSGCVRFPLVTVKLGPASMPHRHGKRQSQWITGPWPADVQRLRAVTTRALQRRNCAGDGAPDGALGELPLLSRPLMPKRRCASSAGHRRFPDRLTRLAPVPEHRPCLAGPSQGGWRLA